jgi:hypothetical protein
MSATMQKQWHIMALWSWSTKPSMRCYPTWCDNIDNTDWEAQEAKRVIKNDKQVLHGVMNERSLLAAEWMLTVLHSYPCFFIQDQQKLQFSSCKNLARHEAQIWLSGRHSFHAAVSLRVLRAVAFRVSLLRFSKMACVSGTEEADFGSALCTTCAPVRPFSELSESNSHSPAFKRWQLPTCKQHQSTPPLHI